MTDLLSKSQRSKLMASIPGKNTSPEIALRKALHHIGLRFRLHVKDLPGKPDLVLPRFKAIIFVNGCFWHGHSCQKDRVPGTNSDFWRNKISTNRSRDAVNIRRLRRLGWRVINIWECKIRKKTFLNESVARICKVIRYVPRD